MFKNANMEELHGRSLSAGSSSSPKKQPTLELSNQFVSRDSGQEVQKSPTAEKQAVVHDIGKECSPYPGAVLSSEFPRLENFDHANGEQIIRRTIDNLGSDCDSSGSFGLQRSEPAEKDSISVAGESALDKGTPVLSRKQKSSVSNRVLRSRSKETPKATKSKVVEVEDTANKSRKRKQRIKAERKNTPTNEFSKIRTHLRYLLHRIKYEKNLIDAYGEGWKGQSIEKIKPEKELQRARSQILRYKLKIRDLFQRLDRSLCEGKLPETLFDSEGQIDSEDIFCAKCGSKDLTLENDIILCDGACERGFHQFCLDPPLSKEDIPPDDEGWLCPGCDCKVDCVEMLNDYLGSTLSVVDNWEKVFPEEAAAAASGKSLDDIDGLPSDDSEDDDYTPCDPGPDNEVSGDESSSDYFSASDDAVPSPDNEQNHDLPSDDSEDDEYDPGAPDHERHAMQETSVSDFTSDSEDLGAILEDSESLGKDEGHVLSDHCKPNAVTSREKLKPDNVKRMSLNDELSYLAGSNAVPLGKRQVERLDYKKLHDETYGDATSDSSDEDYGGTHSPKRHKKGPGKAMQMFTDEIESRGKSKDKVDENQNENVDDHHKLDVTQRSSTEAGPSGKNASRSYRRLGEAVTQKLLEAFRENQYPKQAVKESLAKELGLKVKQVSKWFENTRWSFHHSPRMGSKMAEAASRNGTSSPGVNKVSPGAGQSSLLQSPSCNGVENIASSQVNPVNEGIQTTDTGKGKLIREASGGRGRRNGKFNDQGSGAENLPMHDSRVDTTKSQSQVLRKSSRITQQKQQTN